jgi:hypothetical protein
MKTAREIAHEIVSEGEGCDSWPHEWHCDDATRAARAAQLDTLRWVIGLHVDSGVYAIIGQRIKEVESGK